MYLEHKNKQAHIHQDDLEQLVESLGLFFVVERNNVAIIFEDKVLELDFICK